jgi:hypothetical protein
MRIPSGTTDQYMSFIGLDDSDGVSLLTGLSTFTVYRTRNGGTRTAMTTPTITEKGNGSYVLLMDEDMTIDSGDDSQEMLFEIQAVSMQTVFRSVEIYRSIVSSGQTLGVSGGNLSGAVPSVTGAVGSVTGNVGGNVTGSVGSVTGNVGGNVVGSVASVGALTTGNIADAVWDESKVGHQVANSYGNELQNVESNSTGISNKLGTPAGASVSVDIAAIKSDSAAILVDTAEMQPLLPASGTLATAEDVAEVTSAPDTRDLDEVQHVWVLKRTGSGALQSTDESALRVYAGSEDIRAGWDCNIPSILPNGTVLATMTDPESENEDLTLTKLGIGPNGLRQPMLAKVNVDVAEDATPGTYWITTQVANRLGGGPLTIYGKVIVLAAPD